MTRVAIRRVREPVSLWRGSGFSGLPELLASVYLTLYLLLAGPEASKSPLSFAHCLAAAIAGRWPFVGTGMSVAIVALAGFDQGMFGAVSFLQLVILEALATTGMRWWTWLTSAGYIVLVGKYIFSYSTEFKNHILWLLSDVILLVGALVLGVLRHRNRMQKIHLEHKRVSALMALRHDVARDLHDSVVHDVTTMVLRAGQARSTPGLPSEVIEHLDQIVLTGQHSIQDMRSMLAVLRRDLEDEASQAIWTPGGLQATLERSRARLKEAGFIPDVATNGPVNTLPVLSAEVLSKCLVESISNVLKHAKVGSVCTVRIEVDEAIEMIVISALDEVSRSVSGTHVGVIGMRERVESVRGSFAAGPRGEELWVVEVTLPLKADGIAQ